MASGTGDTAIPLALVNAAAVADPANVALAPLPGAVKVTVTPLTGLLDASFTMACKPAAKAVLTAAVCGVPALAAMLAGGGLVSVSVKFCDVPFRLADSTAVLAAAADTFAATAVDEEPAATETVKLAEFEPAGTTTDGGIVTLAPEATPVVTVKPPTGAGADNATLQAAEPGMVTIAGEQVMPVTVYGEMTFTWPPVAVTLTALSPSVTPVLFKIWIEDDVLATAAGVVKVAVATTPLLSVRLLRPNSMQVYDPEPPLQETDFPAATAAGPAATDTELKVDAG